MKMGIAMKITQNWEYDLTILCHSHSNNGPKGARPIYN